MEYSILGTLQLTADGNPVELRRAKPRTMLAMLLLHPNQVVSVDRLSEALWGECPPSSATNTMQGYVSHLRQVLAADAGSANRSVVRTQAPGYLLEVSTDSVDTSRFERLTAEGRRALANRAPERAAGTLRAALSLWRGQALADFADQPFAAGEAARLEELRLVAWEDLADAELALGHHGELAARLQSLVERNPLRERLWGQLMLALYRCGRQGDALRAFQVARRVLAEELGIDPGPTLRRLEADVLAQAPHLDLPFSARPASSSGLGHPGNEVERQLIGREREIAHLEAALARAVSGAGQVVLISGEPGVGKTRLVEELAHRARAAGVGVAWGRCYEGQGAAAYWPWMQLITGLFDECGAENTRSALLPGAAEIAQIVPEVKEIVPTVGVPPFVDAGAARSRLYEAVTRFFFRMAAGAPLLLLLEDIHWGDVPSLELLEVLTSRVHEAGILIVVTFRDVDPLISGALADALAALARYPGLSRLPLAGLDVDEVGRFVTVITGSEPTPQLAATLHGRTEGNPFFVSELARLFAMQDEAGSGPSTEATEVPVAVRDVIRRRLARLPDGTRDLLAAAAVVGRDFDLDVLLAVSPTDLDTTLDLVEPALRARLVATGDEAGTRYRFSHALVRETIYEQTTPIGRARLHLRVGEALERLHHEDEANRVAELADHFYQGAPAGAIDKAFTYAVQAAEAAQSRLAYEQAEEQLRRGVVLARRLAPDRRDRAELDVQVRLFLLLMRGGYASPGVGEASARARELSRRVPIPRQVEVALTGVTVFSAVRSDYNTAQACGEELVAFGERSHEAMLQLIGHTWLGMVGFLRGELAAAEVHSLRAIAIGDTFDDASLVAVSGVHPLSICRHFAACVDGLRGQTTRARALLAEGIQRADQPGREFTLANALLCDALLGAIAGDAHWALASANTSLELSERYKFHMYHAFSGVVHGWAVARLGDPSGGEAEIETWFAVTQELQATCLRPFHLGLLADVRRLEGRIDAALETVERAIGYSQSCGDRFWDAELHRLRGELLAGRAGSVDQAERSLQQAIAVAATQGATALEARARDSLTRLRSAAPMGGVFSG